MGRYIFVCSIIRQNGVVKESKENVTVKRSSNDATNDDDRTIKREDDKKARPRPLPKVFLIKQCMKKALLHKYL
jgi:hypothetical protein